MSAVDVKESHLRGIFTVCNGYRYHLKRVRGRVLMCRGVCTRIYRYVITYNIVTSTGQQQLQPVVQVIILYFSVVERIRYYILLLLYVRRSRDVGSRPHKRARGPQKPTSAASTTALGRQRQSISSVSGAASHTL